MKRKWSITDVALMGLLIALTVIASRYIKIELTPWLRLTFSSAFIMLAGIWLGPLAGGLVGAISDLLGCMINGYPPFLPYTLAPVLVGVLAGLAAPILKKHKNPVIYAGIIGGITLITTVLVGSWAMSMLYGTPFMVLLWQRAVQGALSTILNTIVVYTLYYSPVTAMLNSQRLRV